MPAGNKRALQGDFAALAPGQLAPWLPYPSSSGRHSCFRIYGTNIVRVGLVKAVPDSCSATLGSVGLADATAEDEAASRWADCRFAYGD